MKEKKLTLNTQDGNMNAFLTLPKQEKASCAVIVIQKAFGVNSHIQNVCRRLSQKGFSAFLASCPFEIGTALSFYRAGIVHSCPGLGLKALFAEIAQIYMPVFCVFGAKDESISELEIDAIRLELSK